MTRPREYVHVRGQTSEYEVAEVLREYGDDYRAGYPLTPEPARVLGALIACRTAALGGQIYECQTCGAVEFADCACRDRHCPKCQKFARAQWVEQQKVYLLPSPYVHVVFTTDHAIKAWGWANRGVIDTLLFTTATAGWQALAAKELGGELGITAGLHPWGPTRRQHRQLHCIVTGGALRFDRPGWVGCAPDYLFDIGAVSAAFREAFCAGRVRLAEQGQLVGVEVAEGRATVASMQAKKWEVFAKPLAQPDTVINYLSRYVHAVAISNCRITNLADGQVSFSDYDNQEGGKPKELTVSAVEFIRRFWLHVLPAGFVRIRYYGLHHSAARKTKLPRARALLGLPPELPKITKLVLAVWLASVVGEDLHRCHGCGARGSLAYRGEVAERPRLWLWLKLLFGVLCASHWQAAEGSAT